MEREQWQEVQEIVEFSTVTLPVKYLGLPLLSTRLLYTDCSPLIAKVMSRIQGWRGKLLSYAGRLHLVKSVLSTLVSYWIYVLLLPMGVVQEVNRLCRNFLWSGPDGGLGIRDLHIENRAAILRRLWNLITKKDTLRVRWVYKNHIKDRCFWDPQIPCDTLGHGELC